MITGIHVLSNTAQASGPERCKPFSQLDIDDDCGRKEASVASLSCYDNTQTWHVENLSAVNYYTGNQR